MELIYLLIITFLAASLQSAIGFGFGLIAVPIFIMLLDSAEAIQIAMILIFSISCIDAFKLRGLASKPLLKSLSIGLIVGLPFGVVIFNHVDLNVLKALIALVIIVSSGQSFLRLIKGQMTVISITHDSHPLQTKLVASISGLMTTSLAMPGPAVMMYFVHKGFEKTLIRATILTYFVIAYAIGIALQVSFVGVSYDTWLTSLSLIPAGILGVLVGHALAPKLNQKLFKLIVLIVLVLTAISMLWQLLN